MATSLATDLGLNYPVRQDRYKTVQDVIWTLLQGVVNIQRQTLEERRAFLGCFYLSSWYVDLYLFRGLTNINFMQDLFLVSRNGPNSIHAIRQGVLSSFGRGKPKPERFTCG